MYGIITPIFASIWHKMKRNVGIKDKDADKGSDDNKNSSSSSVKFIKYGAGAFAIYYALSMLPIGLQPEFMRKKMDTKDK